MNKKNILQGLVADARRDTMASGSSRKRFAAQIADALSLWEPPVYQFANEMRGLNFRNAEDRQTFYEFFMHAYTL